MTTSSASPRLDVHTELASEREANHLLSEALVDLELAAEDRGWQVMANQLDREFSREGLRDVGRNCSLMAVASPMIKRGLQLRTGYVWGQGLAVSARAGDGAEQNVNAVIQDFWDDPSNQTALTSSEAQETLERKLATQGNVVMAFFTNPLTGRVQVRTTPFEEIGDKWTNPEDRDDTWFFLRSYTVDVIEAGYGGGTRRRPETRRVLHPALGHWPRLRPKAINGIPVLWDQPMLHVKVNAPDHAKWGIPDVYASLPWARAYEGFLTDWARLVKALSKFAWKLSGDKSSKAQRAAAAIRTAAGAGRDLGIPDPTRENGAGSAAVMGPGQTLEAIPKTGATVDSGSGRPLAAMVAAGLGVSVVDLLADPGVTGARAVAETLDKPIVLEMNGRRRLWTSVLQAVTGYVVDQAIKAPRGPLKGTVKRDPATDTEVYVLNGDVERTVTVDWPDLTDVDRVQLISAIVSAEGTGVIPPLVIARLLLIALEADDVDEILDEMRDEDGNWIDPALTAAQTAVDDERRRRAAGQTDPVEPPADDDAAA